ncbi:MULTISPECIES: hypothetical protein [unclassified Curtobacterium]|uniref:hypothetical protein n=1 Tax=unclassified Curtobacterium TaxID=257496 RepID=UPI0011141746|nr:MULTISPECIES: hypothetical protein [unclassified Curtobacterium]WIB00304.1 hypothetical protein QOL15_01045 [Curtobacterium sp. MCBA15_012]
MTNHLALFDERPSTPDADPREHAARLPARDARPRAGRCAARDPGSALVVMCAVLVSLAPLAAIEAMLAGLLVGSARDPELVWSAMPLTFLPCVAGAVALRSGAGGLRWWWVLPSVILGALGLTLLSRTFFG